MKVSKIIKGILAVSLAVSFVGCKFDFKPTEVSYDDKEYNLTSVQNESHSVSFNSSVSPTALTFASADSQFSISITSDFGIDEESIDEGVNFYQCTKNTVLNGCPVRASEALTKERLVVDYTYNTTPNTVITTIQYQVNTASVENNTIAVLFDATKIKDKQGTLIMNTNRNETLGEESDSLVKYITVTNKADGTTPAVDVSYAGNSVEEDFSPDLTFSVTSTPNFSTGKIKFVVTGPSYYDATAAHVNSELADIIKQVYVYQTRAIDATDWTDVELNFAFVAADNNYSVEVDLPTDNGSEYRLIKIAKPDLVCEKNAAQVGGHNAYVTYHKEAKKTVAVDSVTTNAISGTFIYYKTSPAYIAHTINPLATAAATFTPETITNATIETAQNALMTVSKQTAAPLYWEISVPVTRPFKTTEGFKVFDKYGKEHECEVVVIHKLASGTIDQLRVYVKDRNYYDDNTKLYAGAETTIDSNVEYPSEVQFGCLPVRADLYHKGLVEVIAD